jgi:hypothetical protein
MLHLVSSNCTVHVARPPILGSASPHIFPPCPQALDQLEEWMKEKPIPYISNDKFSQETFFHYWSGSLSGHSHVNQTYPDVVRIWRQFHGCPASGGGIEQVFFSGGKHHDDLKKCTMDKTLESLCKRNNHNYHQASQKALRCSINTQKKA